MRTVLALLPLLFALVLLVRSADGKSAAPRDAKEKVADLILVGANVITGNSVQPRAEALAVRDGEIVFVGGREEALGWKGEESRLLELDGATVIPGLIDAHAHVASLGFDLTELSLTGTGSWAEIVKKVSAEAKTARKGDWVTGSGWDQNDWAEKEFPSHRKLSAATPDHPVALYRVDGHALVANARAMKLAGIDARTKDPPGGRILRGPGGVPTGVLVDGAMGLVSRHVPGATKEETKAAILRAQDEIVKHGIVGVHDMGVTRTSLEAYREMVEEGTLRLRIYAMLRGSDEALVDEWLERGPRIAPDGARLTVRGIKYFADGALGSRGAAMLEPYSDDPGNRGLVVDSGETLAVKTRAALEKGFQVCVHAIGDAANRAVLDAFELALTTSKRDGDARLRVEHAQVIAPEDLPRFAKLGVIASMQPTHATSDMPWAEDRVGPKRIEGAYAWATLRRHGARIAAGSDFPVEGVNPLWGFHAAVTRADHVGAPEGGWRPGERMTPEEALGAFTLDAAYAGFSESRRGSLETGKVADLVVLDTDILSAEPADLLRAKVLKTIVGGKIVYSAEDSSK